MRIRGLRERSTTHWGQLGVGRGETAVGGEGGELGRDSMGRNAKCG